MTLHLSTPEHRMLVEQLATAANGTLDVPALAPEALPQSKEMAYAMQGALLHAHGAEVGGWKVGARSPGGPASAAPLLARGVCESGHQLDAIDFPVLGVELEIAFRLGHPFLPRREGYAEAEVMDAIQSMAATIEIVTSRYCSWPDVDKLLQLVDFQNHGALIVGEDAPYGVDFPYLDPSISLTLDGVDILKLLPANPAGDPRLLLTWLVNHVTGRGMSLPTGTLITTGSYTGMFFPQNPGVVEGRIAGLPAVSVVLA